mgnify:CR=1 FL=1
MALSFYIYNLLYYYNILKYLMSVSNSEDSDSLFDLTDIEDNDSNDGFYIV